MFDVADLYRGSVARAAWKEEAWPRPDEKLRQAY